MDERDTEENTMMNSPLTLDIAYARKVLEHLIAHPEEHSQNYFGMQEACGTTACIAGTAVLMDPESTVTWSSANMPYGAQQMTNVVVDGTSMDEEDRARSLLGLDWVDANTLFYNFNDVEALGLLASYIDQAEAE
jgi:hypothetical protein